MTLNQLKAALDSRSGLADWKISETRKAGSECFLVGNRPDLSRSVETRDYKVTVYVDQGQGDAKTRGDATVSVHPTMSDTEAMALVDRAVFAASKSRNPWYPLPEPVTDAATLPPSGFEGRAPESWMGELRAALYRNDDRRIGDGARINSLELFLDRIERRVLNSRGVDVAWSSWRGYSEFTVEAEGPRGGVELTDMLSFSEPDLERLASAIARRLEAVRDRAAARPTPALAELPLILAEKEAEEILRWFFANLDASRIYSKTSPLAIGASVHGDSAAAGAYDPLSITAEPGLPGAPGSSPYDADGFALSQKKCAAGGIAQAFHGTTRYAHYLGIPPAGAYSLFSVGPGSIPAADMRAAPSLEVAFFSDFNVDPDSGDFGGEIRLAYWNDGAHRVPISGGSVTGSVLENRGIIRLSREIAFTDAMRGPEAVLLPKVSVTGVE